MIPDYVVFFLGPSFALRFHKRNKPESLIGPIHPHRANLEFIPRIEFDCRRADRMSGRIQKTQKQQLQERNYQSLATG